jgi:hypothetical protein
MDIFTKMTAALANRCQDKDVVENVGRCIAGKLSDTMLQSGMPMSRQIYATATRQGSRRNFHTEGFTNSTQGKILKGLLRHACMKILSVILVRCRWMTI